MVVPRKWKPTIEKYIYLRNVRLDNFNDKVYLRMAVIGRNLILIHFACYPLPPVSREMIIVYNVTRA